MKKQGIKNSLTKYDVDRQTERPAKIPFVQDVSPSSPLGEKSFVLPEGQQVTPWPNPLYPAHGTLPSSKRPASGKSRDESSVPHYAGHRQRLRERLFMAGPDALQDYELLELLLFAAIPRRDVKPLAKKLLADFKDLWSLVNAKPERLMAAGLSESATALLLVTGAVLLRAQKRDLLEKPILSNWQRIVDYCRAAMGHAPKEQFRLLFLDRKNRLLDEEVHQSGTIDHTPVYPREVVQRALEVGAGAIVLVHNHPSGDVTPSKADIDMTRAIVDACKPLGIAIHDHIVIGRHDVASFKSLGLL
jgi:DNA repair protein RadC